MTRLEKREISKVLLICNAFLFIMAYFYEVTYTDDLYRLLPIMHQISSYSVPELINTMKLQNYPVLYAFYYIVGKFGRDGLLPAVTSLITYTFSFKVLSQSAKKNSADMTSIAVAFYIFMARGFFVIGITNVRSIIVVSLFAYMVYSELIEEKSVKWHIPLYIIVALFHYMGTLLVFVRLFFLALECLQGKKTILGLVMIISIVFLIGYNSVYTSNFLSHMNGYIDSAGTGEGYDYIFERIIGILQLIISIYILYQANKLVDQNIEESPYHRYFSFSKMIVSIDVILFFVEYTAFLRINWLISILTMPLFIFLLSNTDEEEKEINKSNVLIIGTVMFLLESSRGYLCSLKYFL
ncbi:EpsG family protein [Ruminococcus sp. XPD3002]|uniref:EpsG family protein n=1 Tax=Ruminococcus sp. XPD3002 TaxID=1452269 RepID=UPI00158705C4